MTEKSVMGKAARLGFRLTTGVYGGYKIVDQNGMIVAPSETWRALTLEEANAWLNRYFQS